MTPYPWQADIWELFEQRMALGKMPHAMLFTGPEGVGKRHFALAFVQRLFCHNVQQGVACGTCQNCHLLSVENHPDQYRVSVLENKKNIGVDQIRKLITYVTLKPHSAPKKVAIIETAELLNTHSANSLLKTLEEPPESCLLILITHRPDQLLPTIRSRCQVQIFTTPKQELALSWLTPKINDSDQAKKLLALAGGAPLQAMAYDKLKLLTQRDDMFSSLSLLLERKKNPVEIASLWLKMDMDIILHCLNSWITDMIRLNVDSQPPVLANPDLQSELLSISQQIPLAKMLVFYDVIHKVPSLRQANINAQLILEDILVQWSRLSQSPVS